MARIVRAIRDKRGAINLQTAAVLPILLALLIAATELFLYYFDLQVINTALDQSFRRAQIDGYFSEAARSIAERELATGFLITDYELIGTTEQKEWGESLEISFTATRSMYIVSMVELTVARTREGLSEYWPGLPEP